MGGHLGPSSYDVAWMARVPADDGGTARWPELVDWLVEHQWLDGSWGGTIPYYHDRILCTLAAIIALKERGTSREAKQAVERGERYIWYNLHRLRHDPFELVGFELIFPTLLTEALDLGIDVPQHTCGYGQIRQEKLKLIPPKLLYSPNVTLVHSLEFLGKDGDPEQMRQALSVNGSLGNSPATTSYYLLREGGKDERALAYLQDMLDYNGHVVTFYPFRTFELAWVLHSLASCHEPLTNLVEDASIWQTLLDHLSERGVGFDPTFSIEDGDTTSVTVLVLKLAGYSVDPAILAQFEDKEKLIFRTYDYERNISTSTNIHALEALSMFPDYPGASESKNCILAFLLASRVFDTYWVDKWHTSPYYTTAHALLGISRAAPEMLDECNRTIDWMVHTQREDGSWGFFDQGTVEESAYALNALLHCRHHFQIEDGLLHRGADYLYHETMRRHDGYHSPPLWIDKCLYIPHNIVRSSILATLTLYEETLGPM